MASRRFLFSYGGQEYVWAKHRKFAGDNLSCENKSTGSTVAYYTNKLLPKKLQGILIIEPQVPKPSGGNMLMWTVLLLHLTYIGDPTQPKQSPPSA